MNEQPVVVQPFQYSTIDSFNPVTEALKRSVKAVFVLAVYALLLAMVLWLGSAFLRGVVLPDSEMVVVGIFQEYIGCCCLGSCSGWRGWCLLALSVWLEGV